MKKMPVRMPNGTIQVYTRVSITIDESTLSKLDAQAEAEGRTRSAHIRELVKLGERDV